MEEKTKGIIIPWMRTLRRGDRPVARPLTTLQPVTSNLKPATTFVFVLTSIEERKGYEQAEGVFNS
jgi:hypothetical protein